jgi:hypothetical protein
MAVEEIRRGEYVDTEPVEAEPGCVRPEPDSAVFQNYMLSRMRGVSDEATTEVLASFRAGRPFGDAVLDVIESLQAYKTKRLRAWVEEARATRIYAYVDFRGLSSLTYGLMITVGGPRDEILARKKIGWTDSGWSFAQYWDFRDALDSVGKKYVFEEDPFVEVSEEDDYNEALEAMEIPLKDGEWVKAGLYDFRDHPPTYSGTVETYERESMKYEAERALEDMFESDEWKTVCVRLLEDE